MFSRQNYIHFISSISLTRTRLVFAIFGSLCLLRFPSFYKLGIASFICLKLVIVLASTVSVIPPFVSHKLGQADIGWYLITSASPLLILQMIFMFIQYVLQTIVLFLNGWELGTKIHLHQILVIEIIGIAFILDDKLHYVRTVNPLLFLIFLNKCSNGTLLDHPSHCYVWGNDISQKKK